MEKFFSRTLPPEPFADTAWQKISVTAEAPRDFRNVYFLIHTGHSDRIVYLDDLQLAEQPSQSRTERDVL